MWNLLMSSVSPSLTHYSCRLRQTATSLTRKACCPRLLIYPPRCSSPLFPANVLLCPWQCSTSIPLLAFGVYLRWGNSLCSGDSLVDTFPLFHCSVYPSHSVYLLSPLLATNQSISLQASFGPLKYFRCHTQASKFQSPTHTGWTTNKNHVVTYISRRVKP